jgi:hypothetical protein
MAFNSDFLRMVSVTLGAVLLSVGADAQEGIWKSYVPEPGATSPITTFGWLRRTAARAPARSLSLLQRITCSQRSWHASDIRSDARFTSVCFSVN